jgi:hypothetical protein
MNILAIKHVNSKEGKPFILVTTASKDIWLTPKQWQSKGAMSSLDSYVGGDIETNYYKEGEVLLDGVSKCTKDDTLLKDFFVSASPAVLAQAFAAESSSKMQKASDMATLFARNKASKVVEAEPLNN